MFQVELLGIRQIPQLLVPSMEYFRKVQVIKAIYFQKWVSE